MNQAGLGLVLAQRGCLMLRQCLNGLYIVHYTLLDLSYLRHAVPVCQLYSPKISIKRHPTRFAHALSHLRTDDREKGAQCYHCISRGTYSHIPKAVSQKTASVTVDLLQPSSNGLNRQHFSSTPTQEKLGSSRQSNKPLTTRYCVRGACHDGWAPASHEPQQHCALTRRRISVAMDAEFCRRWQLNS